MALFSKQKKTAVKKEGKTSASSKVKNARVDRDGKLSNTLKRPWFSEKALMGTEKGVYAFEISADSTKKDVEDAVFSIYGVIPEKVRVLRVIGKTKARRTLKSIKKGQGTRASRKKAYVYLKKGDTLSLA